MLVYGKLESMLYAADARAAVRAALCRVECAPPGIDRHAAIVEAFIHASELAQGIADLEFDSLGYDAPSARQRAGGSLLRALGDAVHRSWTAGFQDAFDPAPFLDTLGQLTGSALLRLRRAEGYAHYALYPESYIASARRSRLDHRCTVIGIRSVGFGLAGIVSAVLGAGAPVSLRPSGHPFRREVRAAPGLLADEVKDRTMHFAVVDEGPGLSGSSLASVASWLMSHGVAAQRIHFFPSHAGGPGPAAAGEVRTIWAAVQRHPARQDDVLCHPRGLRTWLEAKLGPSSGPIADLSAGAWRLRPGQAAPLPPADSRFERRKFLVTTDKGEWLVKFAGLGSVGWRKYADARRLAAGVFVPETPALCHGFMAQRWIRQNRTEAGNRRHLLGRMGEYMAFRDRHFRTSESGASLEALAEMAEQNTREALGPPSAARLGSLLAKALTPKPELRPIRTDSRLHAWEWLWSSAGVMKADAVDHCQGHDLVGCQDVLWDVAGAIAEHDLSRREVGLLCSRIWPRGVGGREPALAAFLSCYLAFQLGLWSTATPSASTPNAVSAMAQADLYAQKLALHLDEAAS